MNYLEMISPPPLKAFPWNDEMADIVALTYGENLNMGVKDAILDRLADKSNPYRPFFYGQLERMEKVVERLNRREIPLPTPYWDALMRLCQKPPSTQS